MYRSDQTVIVCCDGISVPLTGLTRLQMFIENGAKNAVGYIFKTVFEIIMIMVLN